jgi:hypothetical protein
MLAGGPAGVGLLASEGPARAPKAIPKAIADLAAQTADRKLEANSMFSPNQEWFVRHCSYFFDSGLFNQQSRMSNQQ